MTNFANKSLTKDEPRLLDKKDENKYANQPSQNLQMNS